MLLPTESGPGPVRIAPESLYMAILGTKIWKSWAHMGVATGSRNAPVTVPARRGLAVPFAGNLGSMDYRLVGGGYRAHDPGR